ncbi:MAG: anaerobic ribonucleoside-triphosphate reductase [Bacilli bacterium]|nr:anaerobic ribonucleoside-triphosphate reductase [Bacilli bacterium]
MEKDVFEELVVVKRSGQRVNFNGYKIAVAIKHAFDSIYENYDEKNINKVYDDVLIYIEQNYIGRKTINVEDIQDIIETKLKEEKHFNIYQSFHQYRQKRAASRKVFTIKQQHKFVKAMEKIAEDDTFTNDNNYKVKDILLKYGMTVASEFTKSYLVDNKFLRAHEEGYIYINDLNYFSLGMVSNTHLKLGEYVKNIDVDIGSLILTFKDEIHGEINVPGLDYLFENYFIINYKLYLKEYIYKYLNVTGFLEYINLKKINDLIDKEDTFNISLFTEFINNKAVINIIKQSNEDAIDTTKKILKKQLKSLFKNLDLIKQTSISFGTNKSNIGNIINEMILDIISSEKNFKNLKIIFKVNGQNRKYLNKIHELILKGEDVITTFIENSYNKDLNEVEYFADGTRIFENYNSSFRESIGRMIVATTSINISRIALENKDKPMQKFYKELNDVLDLVKNNLLLSFETIGNKNKENYHILFNNNILDDEKLEGMQKIRKVIKNGDLMIGINGLKEAIITLEKNEVNHYKLICDILKFLNKKCNEYMSETKLNFYICEPFNMKSRREFLALDKTVYGIIEGVTENSSYDLIQNLKILKNECKKIANIQKLFLGGCFNEIIVPKNISYKKFENMILNMIEEDIGFMKFSIKRSEGKP